MESMDDAGVYKISDDIALVQTVDFFSPVVNSPYDFGRIVAANSLSDIYAMGGTPRTAMNILAYPLGLIPQEAIEELMQGGCEKLLEAGVDLLGGHTMEQEDFVYGMSVTGVINPAKVTTNATAREGDLIILTKPLGAGPYSDALQKDGLTDRQYNQFVEMMARLNKYAAETVNTFKVSAMTDVTGFGLLGHSLAIAKNADVALEYDSSKIPLLDDIFEIMEKFNTKGVCKNSEYFEKYLSVNPGVDPRRLKLMTEAQTSGGLLIVVDHTEADKAIEKLHQCGDTTSAVIGEIVSRTEDNIFLKVK